MKSCYIFIISRLARYYNHFLGINMEFGKRLTDLRKAQGISQTELASRLEIHKNVLGRYERDQAKPSIEIASRIAELLGVSLDYLVGATDAELDEGIVKQVQSIQMLPSEEKERILFTIDALVRDAKSRFAYSS